MGVKINMPQKEQKSDDGLGGLFQIGGAVVGGIYGGPAGASAGASLGGAVGGAVDKMDKGPESPGAQPVDSAMSRRLKGMEDSNYKQFDDSDSDKYAQNDGLKQALNSQYKMRG